MRILVCGAGAYRARHRGSSGASRAYGGKGACIGRGRMTKSVSLLPRSASGDWLPRLDGIDAVVNSVGIWSSVPDHPSMRYIARRRAPLRRLCPGRYPARGADIGAGRGAWQHRLFFLQLAAEKMSAREYPGMQILRPAWCTECTAPRRDFSACSPAFPWSACRVGGQMPATVHIDDLCDRRVQVARTRHAAATVRRTGWQ